MFFFQNDYDEIIYAHRITHIDKRLQRQLNHTERLERQLVLTALQQKEKLLARSDVQDVVPM